MKTFLYPPRLAVALKNCFIMLSILFAFSHEASAQMKYWTFPPKTIMIPPSLPAVVTPLYTGATGAQYEVANGAYEENGNLIFFVMDNTVYNASGGSVGTFNCLYSSVTGYNYCTVGEEVSIVPVPGSCRQFYVIWPAAAGFTGSAVGYAKIDCSSGVTIATQSTLIDYWGGNASAIAVSKVTDLGTGTRYLFAMGYSSLNRYTISSTGIASKALIVDYNTIGTSSFYWQTSQLVLSSDQNHLAWATGGGATNKVFRVDLSAYSYSTYGSGTLTGDTYLHGVEFNSTSDRIFVSTNNGLKWFTLGWTPTTIASSSTYNNCQLGLALSTYIYCTDNAGKFGRINANITTPTVAVASNLTSQVDWGNATYAPINSSCYRMPDQVDGENYDYFFGIQKAIADFNINGIPIACPSYNQVYNCAAGSMILNNLTTGPATTYSIEVKSATGGDCTTTVSGYDVIQSGISPFSTYDLKTFNGGYLTTHTGYFIVYLTAYNTCGAYTTQQALINVSSNPGSISGSWLQATCSVPTGVAPSASCTAPTVVSVSSAGILASGTGSSISSWTISVLEVSGGTCIASGLNITHTYLQSGGFSAFYKSYNGIIYDATTIPQWWTNHPNKKFLVSYYVTNLCGNSTPVTGYVTNTDITCKIALDENISKEITVFPNPASDEITVSGIPETTKELLITGIDGKLMKTISISNASDGVRISVANLQAGIYLLRTVGPTTSVIKFIKN